MKEYQTMLASPRVPAVNALMMNHCCNVRQVKKPEESKYPWDYFTVKATIPAEEAFLPLAKSQCALVKK